ncbi:MAG TPA: SMC-Scp complex subunit ScpB [Parachlamydiaceae bacterium]|nr:SMC-Scp complex subunit ScpB [Parachlamydiaceae bacterium]
MAKEINLFLQDVEVASEEPVKDPVKKNYTQDFLPGILNNGEMPQNEFRNEEKKTFFHNKIKVKRVIEALLFSANEPISFQKIREITDTIYEFKPRALREIIDELQNDFISKQLVYRLEEIEEGFLLRTSEEFSPYLNILYRNKRIEKLSQAAAEVLAIIAYRQPVTRPQIDSIRGVDSTGTIQALLERQLIEPLGKLEAPGRPTLFGITKSFLKHFGLRDLKELPQI